MPERVKKKKRHFKIVGPVPHYGVLGESHDPEYCWAASPKEARELIRIRLQQRATNPNFRAYLGDCVVIDITNDKRWLS